MALVVNGTTVKKVLVNGIEVGHVTVNGVEVFTKQTTKTWPNFTRYDETTKYGWSFKQKQGSPNNWIITSPCGKSITTTGDGIWYIDGTRIEQTENPASIRISEGSCTS